jgi:hypothetical protein
MEDYMHDIGPIFVTLIVFYAIVYIIKYFLDYLLKRKLINQNLIDSDKVKLFLEPMENPLNSTPRLSSLTRLSSLKWGLVLIALGGGMYFGVTLLEKYPDETAAGLGFSAMLGFAGIALIVYYLIVSIVERRNKPTEQ